MRFKIVGAHAESGDDIDVMLEAPSRPDVERLAHDKGILVSAITPLAAEADGDPTAIALIDDDPPAVNGTPAAERPHGIITVNANNPGDTAHTGEGHIAEHHHTDSPMEYHIIMNQSLYLLESAVNKHLREGWEPAGGMSVATSNNALNYFQSMIRRKKTT